MTDDPQPTINIVSGDDCGYVDNMSSDEYNALMAKESKSKYGNKKTVVDGITFDSVKEANRYVELKRLQGAGEIEHLSRQQRIPCNINNKKVCDYVADFKYWDFATSSWIYEDVKGYRTDVYRIKKKLVEALYGITITEV